MFQNRIFFTIIYSIVIIFYIDVRLMAQPPRHHTPHEHFSHKGQHHQLSPEAKEKLEAYKIAYFTRKLELTPGEAKVFWPLYEAYQLETRNLKKACRLEGIETREKLEQLSDAEIEFAVDNMMLNREKEFALAKAYHQKFKEILPIRKVALLYKTERDFRRELIEQLKRE